MNSIDHLGDSGRELIKACVKVKIFDEHKVCEYSQDEAAEKISGDDCVGTTCSVDEVLDGESTRNAVVRGSQQRPVEHVDTHSQGYDSDSQRKKPSGQQGIVSDVEIDYGTGFKIDRRFIYDPDLLPDYSYIVTPTHVIQDKLDDKRKEVRICNQFLDDLPCDVVKVDASTDLALLRCCDPKLKKIPGFELCDKEPLPGQDIFSFGYPASYTGESALFLKGCVAGTLERFGRPNLEVLDYPAASHGCSGSPVMQWVGGKIKVVAVILQKHIKNVLSIPEEFRMLKIRERLAATTITDSQSDTDAIHLLVLKLYDAQETHSPFANCNAIPVVKWKYLCTHPMNGDLSNERSDPFIFDCLNISFHVVLVCFVVIYSIRR